MKLRNIINERFLPPLSTNSAKQEHTFGIDKEEGKFVPWIKYTADSVKYFIYGDNCGISYKEESALSSEKEANKMCWEFFRERERIPKEKLDL